MPLMKQGDEPRLLTMYLLQVPPPIPSLNIGFVFSDLNFRLCASSKQKTHLDYVYALLVAGWYRIY
jgi:hypothetical protein